MFSGQAGISLHRYLAFIKIQKAFLHVRKGKSLTRAALDAGFDSPSHLAATFKRMFGISFSQFLKSAE
ncbi:MAG: AraC family transcriptional regulator [Treponema sp.]|nr:AraC family transcriptional regulator [Treponema sp.]MBQ6567508.1 AraC family transcriptional regulator [Treponema sp.]